MFPSYLRSLILFSRISKSHSALDLGSLVYDGKEGPGGRCKCDATTGPSPSLVTARIQRRLIGRRLSESRNQLDHHQLLFLGAPNTQRPTWNRTEGRPVQSHLWTPQSGTWVSTARHTRAHNYRYPHVTITSPRSSHTHHTCSLSCLGETKHPNPTEPKGPD